MDSAQYSKLFNYLWNIANDVLVQVFEKGDYKNTSQFDQAVEGLTQQVAVQKEYKQRLIADVVTGQIKVM